MSYVHVSLSQAVGRVGLIVHTNSLPEQPDYPISQQQLVDQQLQQIVNQVTDQTVRQRLQELLLTASWLDKTYVLQQLSH